jgi:ubiquinone/menaquinone biosynthesis C-methylase UbiE
MPGLENILVCPICHKSLKKNTFYCSNCKMDYFSNEYGKSDFRLKKIKKVGLNFNIGENVTQAKNINFKPLTINKKCKINFSKIQIPRHLNKELISHFPKAKKGQRVLDLGCGDTRHQAICEYLGYEYIGLDYDPFSNAPILGDAHCLPFKNNSLDFIISVAVLEHLKYPFMVMKEIARVLKPEGILIGTVAFLEPYHSQSLFHPTHLGVQNLLEYTEFKIKNIAANPNYTVLRAQQNILFPFIPSNLRNLIIFPVQLLHQLWWKILALTGDGQKKEMQRVLHSSGSFVFIAQKK